MTTSYRDSQMSTSFRGGNSTPWKIATLVLAISTAALGFLYANEKQDSHGAMPTNTMSGAHYDHGFINMMIPHHQQAIDEANRALTEAQHPELKQLARNIIDSQQAEINQMKQWRKQWYGD
jgi:uncharacterized protein (DUF305 family)